MTTQQRKQTELERWQVVRALIEQGWTQGAWARDADGNSVGSTHTKACQWCILGAIGRVFDNHFIGAWNRINRALDTRLVKEVAITQWQDCKRRRKADVLALIDKVIATVGDA